MNTFRKFTYLISIFTVKQQQSQGCGAGIRIDMQINVTKYYAQKQTHTYIDFDKSKK